MDAAPAHEPPLSTPAYARVRDRLRADILAGRWPPGAHRTLADLAGRHGVSLSPVREALLHLQGEGLVELRQHRGAVVPLLDAALLADLYDVRAALQSLLAGRAAERATPAALEAAAAAQRGFARAAREGDAAAALAQNEAFHAAVDAAGGNPQARALLAARTALVNAARLRLGYGPKRLKRADAQHRAILAAIAGHDAEAAARAAFEHAMAGKRDLLARLGETPGEDTP